MLGKVSFGVYEHISTANNSSRYRFHKRDVIIDQIVARMDVFDNSCYTKEFTPETWSNLVSNLSEGANLIDYKSMFSRQIAAKFVDYVINETKNEGGMIVYESD
jgi:hypothetical protein